MTNDTFAQRARIQHRDPPMLLPPVSGSLFARLRWALFPGRSAGETPPPRSTLTADYLNKIQRELTELVTAAGRVPDGSGRPKD